MNGLETIRKIREQTDTILLAFSCGKDSIAAWLECRKHFPNIIPFYMYLVPNLEFVENSLEYYERWFGCRIARVPHPSLYRMLNNLVFQAPQNCSIIEAARLPNFDYTVHYDALREKHELPGAAYAASGVRAVDSPYRMIALRKYGPISHKKHQFFPIWDWNKERLVAEIRSAAIKLPVDYRIFGRSFDGIDYRFLEPISRHFPKDYRRILEYFPLAGVEINRRQYAA